jgi:hypothetical protein
LKIEVWLERFGTFRRGSGRARLWHKINCGMGHRSRHGGVKSVFSAGWCRGCASNCEYWRGSWGCRECKGSQIHTRHGLRTAMRMPSPSRATRRGRRIRRRGMETILSIHISRACARARGTFDPSQFARTSSMTARPGCGI